MQARDELALAIDRQPGYQAVGPRSTRDSRLTNLRIHRPVSTLPNSKTIDCLVHIIITCLPFRWCFLVSKPVHSHAIVYWTRAVCTHSHARMPHHSSNTLIPRCTPATNSGLVETHPRYLVSMRNFHWCRKSFYVLYRFCLVRNLCNCDTRAPASAGHLRDGRRGGRRRCLLGLGDVDITPLRAYLPCGARNPNRTTLIVQLPYSAPPARSARARGSLCVSTPRASLHAAK